jgi:O-antigen ligase
MAVPLRVPLTAVPDTGSTFAAARGGPAFPRPARYVLLAASAVPIGAVIALGLRTSPLPLALAFAAGVVLVGTLALTITHEPAAVAGGLLLLGVVAFEPAPSDLVFFVVIAVALVQGRLEPRRVPRPILVTLGVFVALNLVSAVQVVDAGRAVGFMAITLYLAAFGLWLTGYVRSTGRARLVERGYLVAALASAVVGLVGLAAPVPGRDLLLEASRARALFRDPNVFGPFLVPAALIVMEELLEPRLLRARPTTKVVWLLLLVLGVLFSYSRAAWLNLVVGVVVVGVLLSLRAGGARKALGFALVVAVAAGAVVAVVALTGSGAFLAERARPQAYDANRFGGQLVGIQSAERYPFGVGPGQYESVAHISAHSGYVRVLGEQGVPGLATLVAFLGLTLALALRNALRGYGAYGIGSAALLGAWCGLLVNSFFIDTLHWRHLWLVAALIWAAAMRYPTGRSTSRGTRRVTMGA